MNSKTSRVFSIATIVPVVLLFASLSIVGNQQAVAYVYHYGHYYHHYGHYYHHYGHYYHHYGHYYHHYRYYHPHYYRHYMSAY
jgi:hypothetical protein